MKRFCLGLSLAVSLGAPHARAQSCTGAPAEARGLALAGAGASQLTWLAPVDAGGSSLVLYDALRSGSAGNFTTATCLASGVPDLNFTESAFAGSAFYLVRSRNGCGGTLGSDSGGTPIAGANCPQSTGGQCFNNGDCVTTSCCTGYCRDLATDPDHCTDCAISCDAVTATSRGCNGTTCTYVCAAGRADCNTTAPDTDGCECAGSGCCGSGCQVIHSNGLGQNYYDCTALGTPGVASTYTAAMATSARAAWPFTGTPGSATCSTASALFQQTATSCAVWVYTKTLAGYVHLNSANNSCFCPTAADPTWN